MADQLPDAIYAKVKALSDQGNQHMSAHRYTAAVASWEQALALLPQPQALWDAALWLHASIGDGLRSSDDLAGALDQFRIAANCADGATNPFVLFNIGACLLDLGNEDEAVDPLLRAYMLEGEEIFEDEDSKYIDLLRRRKLVD